MAKLNDLAARVWACLLEQYPAWGPHLGTRGEDDLEADIPAPEGAISGRLVVSTEDGEHVWIRFAPPAAFYSVDDDDELLRVVDALITEKVLFVTTWRNGDWTGTTLLPRATSS